MIEGYQKFRIPDYKGKNHIVAEVNWDENDPEINACKVIKLKLPTGDTAIIKREDLNQILFAIGDADSQMRLIPEKLTTVHWRKTMLGVKATKDIKIGEMVNFPIEISFPCSNVRETIGRKLWSKDVKQQQKKDKWASPIIKL